VKGNVRGNTNRSAVQADIDEKAKSTLEKGNEREIGIGLIAQEPGVMIGSKTIGTSATNERLAVETGVGKVATSEME
jgi:translation elongation factor EF-1beta